MTFEPCQVALGAWQEIKSEAMSVNEEGTVRLDGADDGCGCDDVLLPGNEVSSCVGGVAEQP